MTNKNPQIVLNRLRQTMDGLNRLIESLDNPPPGNYRDIVSRIAVEGRALTNVAQNLKTYFPNFEKWYAVYQDEMNKDSLCRFFYKLRTEKLKEGNDRIKSFSLSNRKNFNLCISGETIAYSYQDETGQTISGSLVSPKNNKGFFIDSNGIGWNVSNNDGIITKKYAEVPMHQIGIDLWFDNPPQSHKGKPIKDTSAENLCKMYVGYLIQFFDDLVSTFFTN